MAYIAEGETVVANTYNQNPSVHSMRIHLNGCKLHPTTNISLCANIVKPDHMTVQLKFSLGGHGQGGAMTALSMDGVLRAAQFVDYSTEISLEEILILGGADKLYSMLLTNQSHVYLSVLEDRLRVRVDCNSVGLTASTEFGQSTSIGQFFAFED